MGLEQRVESFVNAATMVCLRRSRNSRATTSTWEVLLGQSEVKNWIRSTRERDVFMRYPGEWKFPGGACECGDTCFLGAAIRELEEEFLGIIIPHDIRDRTVLFNTKLTLPVQGRQYRMHNFVFIDDDNIWDDALIEAVNFNLEEKRSQFTIALADGSYWSLTDENKHSLSPEIHRIAWMDIQKAIDMMAESTLDHLRYADDFQEQEFVRYGIGRRDPMYQSQMVLTEIASLPNLEAIFERGHSNN
jgi:8-oxo-dGTP pyrophosphatase MutT (NUDIX family)